MLKVHFSRLLLIAVFTGVFFLLILFPLTQRTGDKSVFRTTIAQNQTVIKPSPGLPVRLAIPVINVNAVIQQAGVNSQGTMEVPNNVSDVGWFKLGPRPGERGSAVIAGHLNGDNGEVGVFADLDKLKEGDKLYVEDDHGNSTVFVVRESLIYNPGYADDVFSSSDSAHLNLITCDGVWDKNKKSYTKRLVVFADIML